MTQAIIAAGVTEKTVLSRLLIHIVYNNVPYKSGLETGWGFACQIEGLNKTVLFDTGGNGDILLSNMQRLGLDPESIEIIVLSHIHSDHTGGLGDLLTGCHRICARIISGIIPAGSNTPRGGN